jgi:hypothetical protein
LLVHSDPTPVKTTHTVAAQVRCYIGDNEQRWYMWYSGAAQPLTSLAGVAPASGSVGE